MLKARCDRLQAPKSECAYMQPDHQQLLQTVEQIRTAGALDGRNQVELLSILGRIAADAGLNDLALGCLTRATAIAPHNAEHLAALGDVLHRAGRDVDAQDAYCRAAAVTPGHTNVHARLAHLLLQQGRAVESTEAYRLALRFDPTNASIHRGLGRALEVQGSHSEALEAFQRSIELNPHDPKSYVDFGYALLHVGAVKHAVTIFRRGLLCGANEFELHAGLAKALLRAGSFEEAVRACTDALMVNPDSVDVCRDLVCGLELLGHRDETIWAWCSYGTALARRDQFSDAADAYREALKRKPNCLRALIGLGCVSLQLAEPHEAVARLEAARAIDPANARVHQRLGWAYAFVGDLESSWEEMSWFNYGASRRFEQPVWDGSPLSGRTILLWSSAGLGDAVQFIRFAETVKGLGARVVVECQPQLLPLFKQAPYIDAAVPINTPLPRFDLHAPPATLQRVLRTRWDTIPSNIPYLMVEGSLITAWRQRLQPSEAMAIGLVWSGKPYGFNARLKSMRLSDLMPLANLEGVRFISLQLGPPAGELLTSPFGPLIEVFLNESTPIVETAALIMNLDLVITVDTMIAHLAGALGKPVWTMLAHGPDWRWRLDGELTPWYPTMRLFRQSHAGRWSEVVISVRSALESILGTVHAR